MSGARKIASVRKAERGADSSLLAHSLWHDRVFNGGWHESAGGSCEFVEPTTGKALGRTGLASPADIAIAAQAAAVAQKSWLAFSPRERVDVLRATAALLQGHFDELASWNMRETGGVLFKGQHEVRESVNLLNLAATMVLQPAGIMLPQGASRQSMNRRRPYGVVGVVSSFNFPLLQSVRAVAPALAAGNAVVLVPHVQTPISGGYILARALELSGLPKGVLHVLPGAAEAVKVLCTNKLVRMISFSGSLSEGRLVNELGARHFKKVCLEPSSINSLIVLEDADIDVAVSNAAWGAYFHQGQTTMAATRILVQERIAGEFTRRLAERARTLIVGDPASSEVALGPLINDAHLQRVAAIVRESIAAGARLDAGGSYRGLFYQPTVLSEVRPGMRCFDEEIGGPVTSVVSFGSDQEAVSLANNIEYGVSAAVISPSVSRAMAIADELNANMLHINDQTVNDEWGSCFAGRGSGGGLGAAGVADWNEYSQWQWLTVKDRPPLYPF